MLRRATEDDALDVAPLVQEAAPHLRLIIGGTREALRAAAVCYRNPRTMFSCRYGMVAEEDGGLTGVVMAFPGRQWGSLRLGTGVMLARAAGVRHAADLVRRGRVLDRLHPAPPRDALYVSALAVVADHRRMGVGRSLMDRVVAGATGLGLDVTLDVDLDNEAARKLYASLGFVDRKERVTTPEEREVVETPGFVRMLRLRGSV